MSKPTKPEPDNQELESMHIDFSTVNKTREQEPPFKTQAEIVTFSLFSNADNFKEFEDEPSIINDNNQNEEKKEVPNFSSKKKKNAIDFIKLENYFDKPENQEINSDNKPLEEESVLINSKQDDTKIIPIEKIRSIKVKQFI